MSSANKRRANNALGILMLSLIFLFETVVADHKTPNPASPFVWSVLGLVAVASLIAYCWYRFKAPA